MALPKTVKKNISKKSKDGNKMITNSKPKPKKCARRIPKLT